MLNKLYSLVLAAVLAGFGAQAQTTGLRPPTWCGTAAEQERYFAAHPGAREAQAAMLRQLETRERAQLRGPAGNLAAPDVTIPVVVHVIHTGGANNISDQQVFSALEQLNIDYQKRNADTVNTLPLFRPIAAAIGFQFVLAQRDPGGNCTTGITRHYAPTLANDDFSGAVQAVALWDPARYLNIWVVASIMSAPGFIVQGYSTLPQNGFNPRDGFVVRNDYFGNQGTSSPARAMSRVATHEIGHYFGLLHPWGNNNTPEVPGYCNDTDYVADTPPTNGTFSCNLNYAPCGPIANVQNFMDYAACPTMFTQGQRQRVRSILSMVRTGLTTPNNLAATGTNPGFVPTPCAPLAAIGLAPGSRASVCINTPVTLQDYSSNSNATGGTVNYTWSAPGGNPNRATGPTVTVSFPTAGFYTVTETVSNGVGSRTATFVIKVEGPTGGETAPLVQSFEDPNFPNLFAAPSLRNYETSGTTSAGAFNAAYVWRRQDLVPAADGNAYLVVNNRIYPAGAIATLITPNINLAGVAGQAVVSFARAYALRTATDNLQLRVSFSNDCGVNWSAPAVFNAADLSTQGQTPIDGFVPAARSDWQTLSVPVPAQFQGSGLFKVRFQLVNGTPQSNNFYFDNLRIGSPLATKADALASRGIAVYPNPLTHETAVHLNLSAATEVQVRLTDLLGRNVLTLPAKTYGVGAQTVPLATMGAPLRAGVYVVRITLGSETFATKLTVE